MWHSIKDMPYFIILLAAKYHVLFAVAYGLKIFPVKEVYTLIDRVWKCTSYTFRDPFLR